MSRSKIEEQLKRNERYPLRSLNSSERALYDHQEELAQQREKARAKRKEEKS